LVRGDDLDYVFADSLYNKQVNNMKEIKSWVDLKDVNKKLLAEIVNTIESFKFRVAKGNYINQEEFLKIMDQECSVISDMMELIEHLSIIIESVEDRGYKVN